MVLVWLKEEGSATLYLNEVFTIHIVFNFIFIFCFHKVFKYMILKKIVCIILWFSPWYKILILDANSNSYTDIKYVITNWSRTCLKWKEKNNLI